VAFYDWLLFLHVLSAFSLVGAAVVFWTIVLATRSETASLTQRSADAISRPANVAIIAGTAGTIIFGIWLALDIDGYGLLDFWIIAAIVLWLIATELGRRARGAVGDATGRFAQWHWLRAAVVVLLLADMIFKPGA
jgi:hypothetical protein